MAKQACLTSQLGAGSGQNRQRWSAHSNAIPRPAPRRGVHCFDGYPRGEFTLSAANSLEPLNVECGRSSSAVVAMVDHYCTSVWDLRPRHDTPRPELVRFDQTCPGL